MDALADVTEMGESSINILSLSESALNSLKKSNLVQKILDLKGKVIILLTYTSYPIIYLNLNRLYIKFHWKTGNLEVKRLLQTKCKKKVTEEDNKFRKTSGEKGAIQPKE